MEELTSAMADISKSSQQIGGIRYLVCIFSALSLSHELPQSVFLSQRYLKKEKSLGPEYNTAITQINALKEQFLKDLDERTMREIDELDQSAKTIEVRMIFIANRQIHLSLCHLI